MPRFSTLDRVIERYGLPPWVSIYAVRYVKHNPLAMIKKGVSFINYRRKKGIINKNELILPNGVKFDKDIVAHIANLFLFGEEKMHEITSYWGSKMVFNQSDPYLNHYTKISEDYERGARAINSLINGIGRKYEDQDKISDKVKAVFDYIKSIDNQYGRMIATHIIVKYAYARTFGFVFYKVFYPVSPEFMRQIKSVFSYGTEDFIWGESEAKRIINDKLVSHDYIVNMSRELLTLACAAVTDEVEDAKKEGITIEVELLRDISVAYPFHVLAEAGVNIDPDKEAESILSKVVKEHSGK